MWQVNKQIFTHRVKVTVELGKRSASPELLDQWFVGEKMFSFLGLEKGGNIFVRKYNLNSLCAWDFSLKRSFEKRTRLAVLGSLADFLASGLLWHILTWLPSYSTIPGYQNIWHYQTSKNVSQSVWCLCGLPERWVSICAVLDLVHCMGIYSPASLHKEQVLKQGRGKDWTA